MKFRANQVLSKKQANALNDVVELLKEMNDLVRETDLGMEKEELHTQIDCYLVDLEMCLVEAGLKKRGRVRIDDDETIEKMRAIADGNDFSPEKLAHRVIGMGYEDRAVKRAAKKYRDKYPAKPVAQKSHK